MRIVCVGGGPAGLYFSLLLKKANPACAITVKERNAPGETFGFGVVFSDETLAYLEDADPETAREIKQQFAHWDDIEVHVRGRSIRSRGHGFSGIARRSLLAILTRRAQALGVDLEYGQDISTLASLADFDVIVACDGVNSTLRREVETFIQPTMELRASKYIWLGTKQNFDAFQFFFEEFAGGIFQAHAYRFEQDASTFIVETDEATWHRAQLDTLPQPEQLQLLEQIFAAHLGGEKLTANRSRWAQFPTLRCQRWSAGNIVFMGDAIHTAHFSIGSGTKMAMEDAIALAKAMATEPSLDLAFAAYEKERRVVVEKTQAAADDSLGFFEHTQRYIELAPETFAFRLLTRSKKIGYENLSVRDGAYVQSVASHYAEAAATELGASAPKQLRAPMFTPLQVRSVRLENRTVVSPMCMYSAQDGVPNDFHLVHLGSRAIGGAGLLLTEMTNVSAAGRITLGCTGLYSTSQIEGFRRIVDFVHAHSKAKIGVQLGHAGRKGATKLMWEGMDEPLTEGAWPLLSASAIPYYPHSQVPKAMDAQDMERVHAEYVTATKNALVAGFDWLEVHMAHGYLLASFISPLTNSRTDEFGGSIEARMRFPLRIFEAVRAVWPTHLPMSVRLSATDWHDEGLTPHDLVWAARALKERGCDLIDVSSGQTVAGARPKFYGRMFQTPFADQIRNDVGIKTMAVGNITTADQANTILAAGRADLILLAREHLRDPYFTMHAAEAAGFSELAWPLQYGPVAPRPLGPGRSTP